jgi:hypothetical protein
LKDDGKFIIRYGTHGIRVAAVVCGHMIGPTVAALALWKQLGSWRYALRAKVDGDYPDVRLGTVHLYKGEVWKYGESINGVDRYLQSYYKSVGPGVDYDPQYRGTQMQAKVMEKVRLYGYFVVYKTLPPGNCCFK